MRDEKRISSCVEKAPLSGLLSVQLLPLDEVKSRGVEQCALLWKLTFMATLAGWLALALSRS